MHMRIASVCVAVVIACGAATGRAEEAPHPHQDASLAQAQKDLAEATRLNEAGKYDEAIRLGERALRIREKALGPSRLEVAECLHLLGRVHRRMGNYTRAEPLLQRALEIRETLLGENHPDVAQTLIQLAIVYQSLSLADRAETFYQRAIHIQEATLGGNHPDVGRALGDLGNVYRDLGLHDLAEPLLQRAVQIMEEALGKNHIWVAAGLNNLASLYFQQGSYDRAGVLIQRSLQIYEASGEKYGLGLPLSGLASIYFAQHSYDRAEPLARRALQLWEAAPGDNRYHIANTLNTLANIYSDQGLYDRAEPLLRRALKIGQAAGLHTAVADSINTLANLYRVQGFYDRAGALYQRELRLLETTQGKNHPFIIDTLADIAQVYLAKGQLSSAVPLLERALSMAEGRLRREALAFSEVRLGSILSLLRAQEETHYNLLREHPYETAVLRLALGTALLRKGRSAGEVADATRAIYRNLGPADRETFQRLRALRTQFSSLSVAGSETLTPAEYKTRLREFEAQADVLEAELAQHSAFFRAQRQFLSPDQAITRVTAALPGNGALIELVAFSASPVVPPLNTPPSKVLSTPAYLALILLPSGDIRAVDLGPAEVIDGAVRRLRIGLSSSEAENYLPAAQELYRLVFQPLQPVLGAQRRLFISPDGQLNLVPFDSIHDGTRFVTDTFDITYLTSGRDLVRKSEDVSDLGSVVVLADPDFGAPPLR
ncbi:MAG TPA: tetratricopeptide repeat protein [Polyangia bacterium]|nr:tetratricopeptide repeat protein [Polyangia bacterium]